MLGFLRAFALAMGSGLLYEWLMLAYKGATLDKMAFVPPLVPFAASLLCSLLTLVVYLSPLFDNSGRLQGSHDKAPTI
jgi:hypothetical protein